MTTTASAFVRDRNLTLAAKGALATITNTPTLTRNITAMALATASTDGVFAARNALEELVQHGYLTCKPGVRSAVYQLAPRIRVAFGLETAA